jgi:DNA-binding response OmpR family regulator
VLQDEGWVAQTALTAAAAQRAIAQQPPDVVLLDARLPDANVLDLCRRWHAAQPTICILMLTARGDPIDQLPGQARGADDYLPKPFEKRALLARLRALLPRTAAAASNTGTQDAPVLDAAGAA